MRLFISHLTEYVYQEPVRLNPHVLRLRARSTSRQKVESFSLSISPEPVHTVVLDSIDDSLCHRLYFVGHTDRLTIETTSIVDAKPSLVPEDLHLYSTTALLPLVYSDSVCQGLASFFGGVQHATLAVAYAEQIAQRVHYQTDQFLIELARQMNQEFRQIYRESGWPMDPDLTLQLKEGSCRDLAWFYVACCRSFGLAARFISGYVYDDARCDDGGELHAWAEVYLLGYGWVGYDPSYACQAGERHIKLCAGALPHLCSPVDGSYLGVAHSELRTRVIIRPA